MGAVRTAATAPYSAHKSSGGGGGGGDGDRWGQTFLFGKEWQRTTLLFPIHIIALVTDQFQKIFMDDDDGRNMEMIVRDVIERDLDMRFHRFREGSHGIENAHNSPSSPD